MPRPTMENVTPIPPFAPSLSEFEGTEAGRSEEVLGTEREGVLVEVMGDIVMLLTRLLEETPLELVETDVTTFVATCAVKDCGGGGA